MNKNAEIPSYKSTFDLLLLPEWLNGKELNCSSFVEDKERETATLMDIRDRRVSFPLSIMS